MNRFFDWIPFIAISTGTKAHLNFSRIIEAIIIAIVAGGLSAYITVQKLELKLSYLEEKVDKIYEDVYQPGWKNKS